MRAPRRRRGAGAEPESWLKGAKILLVEDDHEMRRMLAATLRRAGYFVLEAADGDDALEWLGPGVLEGDPDRLPDLIVSDVRLPYFSGLELAEGVRLSRKPVPVVLITGFGDPEVHARARELGAHCVLDKPFELQALRDAVRMALHANATSASAKPHVD